MDENLRETTVFIKMKLPVVPKPKDRTQSFYEGVARPELPPPFVSKDTIKALRITIKSIIDLIELLLGPSFNLTYVLTAKFNQDCLEVSYIVVQWRTLITDLMTRIYFIFFYTEVFWDHSLSGWSPKQTNRILIPPTIQNAQLILPDQDHSPRMQRRWGGENRNADIIHGLADPAI